jgi:dTDP-4-dehydrorhamnose 3,5-epimerase
MPLSFTETDISGVMIIEPTVFKDGRGFFLETYHYNKYSENGIDIRFVQDNHSHSIKGTLRGLHYQLKHPQGKLLYVIKGEIFDVAIDIRKGSPGFGKWVSVILSDENKRQLYVPPGFAHGFCVLSEKADVIYKCTDFYAPDDEYGIIWNDPDIGIDWPETNPVLSDKDSNYNRLNDLPEGYLPLYSIS